MELLMNIILNAARVVMTILFAHVIRLAVQEGAYLEIVTSIAFVFGMIGLIFTIYGDHTIRPRLKADGWKSTTAG